MGRSSPRPAALLAATLLALLGSAAAQDGETEQKEKRRAARVAKAGDKAKVQRPGESDWSPLRDDALLESGDRVHAKGDGIELVVPRDKKMLESDAAYAGNRVVLAPGAKATVDPLDTPADLRLDEGDAFAQSQNALKVQAGKSLLTVREGDAEIKLKKNKSVDVLVHSGTVDLEGPSGKRTFAASRHVSIDARGEPTRERRKKLKTPKYAAFNPKKLIWGFTAKRLPEGAYVVPLTDKRRTHMVDQDQPEETPPDPKPDDWDPDYGHWGHEIRTETMGTLFKWEQGARIRVQCWLSRPTTLGLQLKTRIPGVTDEGGQPPNISDEVLHVRGGVWTEVDFSPEAFRKVSGDRPKDIKPDYRAHILVIYAGALNPDEKKWPQAEDPTFELRVKRVLVYVPERD